MTEQKVKQEPTAQRSYFSDGLKPEVYLDDSLERLRLFPDGCVDCIITDPPYEVATSGAGMYKQKDKRYVKELKAHGIADGFSPDFLDEMCRVMKKINICIFCSQKQIIPLLDYFVKGKGCNYNILSWHKTNPIPACGNKYITDTEFVLFFREKGVKVLGTAATKKTWWATPLNVADKHKWGHPTCKPELITDMLVQNHCKAGGVVLDPFMGSGTTGVSAVRFGCKFVGVELKKEFLNVAVRRIMEAYDGKPN